MAHLDEPTDAVLFVHHEIARFQFHKINGFASFPCRLDPCGDTGAAGEVALGEQRGLRRVVDKTVLRLRTNRVEMHDADLIEHALEAAQRALCRGCDNDRVILANELAEMVFGLLATAVEILWRHRIDLHVPR